MCNERKGKDRMNAHNVTGTMIRKQLVAVTLLTDLCFLQRKYISRSTSAMRCMYSQTTCLLAQLDAGWVFKTPRERYHFRRKERQSVSH
jgi:hypothetical protein